MKDTLVEAPKMFREMDGVELENVQLPNALETLWYCRNVELNNVKINKGDYLFTRRRYPHQEFCIEWQLLLPILQECRNPPC